MIRDGHALAAMLFDEPPDPRVYLGQFGFQAPVMDDVDDAAPLPAEVQEDIWIIRCCDRAGGLVWLPERLAWCHVCGGSWRRVVMPSERAEIERVLSMRPDVGTRNWTPSESVPDLERENDEHGVGRAA